MRVLLNRTHIEHPFLIWRRLAPATRSRILIGIVVLAAAVLSMAAGYIIIGNRMRLALLIFGPLVAIPAFFLISRYFKHTILMLSIAAMAIPIDIPTGTYTRIPISMVIAIALCGIWLVSMAIRNNWRLSPSPINRPMLLFCLACTISLIWGIAWRDPILRMEIFGGSRFLNVQIGSLLCYLISIGVALLIGNFIQTIERLKFILGAFLIFGGVSTILLAILRIDPYPLNARGLWGIWFAIPAYALALFHPTLHFRWRVLLIVLVLLHLYLAIVINITWKSGWVPVVVGLFIVTWIQSKRAFFILLATTAIALALNSDLVMQIINTELEEGSDGRIGMWEINLRVVGDHWLLGTGPAGYAPYYMTYFPWDARSTHNNHLDILAQFGVVGTVLWWWLSVAGVIEGIRLIKQAPPGILHILAVSTTSGWICAQIAMFFGDWVLPFAYNQTVTGFKYTVYTWIWLGLLISIRAMLNTQQEQQHAPYNQ